MAEKAWTNSKCQDKRKKKLLGPLGEARGQKNKKNMQRPRALQPYLAYIEMYCNNIFLNINIFFL